MFSSCIVGSRKDSAPVDIPAAGIDPDPDADVYVCCPPPIDCVCPRVETPPAVVPPPFSPFARTFLRSDDDEPGAEKKASLASPVAEFWIRLAKLGDLFFSVSLLLLLLLMFGFDGGGFWLLFSDMVNGMN